MPAYNADRWIAFAIHSVQSQSYSYWELIIMDDGSIDDTAQIIKSIARQDTRIHYHFQPNQGQGLARRNAIIQSKGSLIALLDADDYWLPHRLQKGIEMLQLHKVDLVYSSAAIIKGENQSPLINQLAESPIYEGEKGVQWLFTGNRIPALTTLFTREAYDRAGGFGNYRGVEDYALWLGMMAKGARIMGIPEVTAVYRLHNDSDTAKDRVMVSKCLEVFRDFYRKYPKYRKYARNAIFEWIEENVCRGCSVETKLSHYKDYGVLHPWIHTINPFLSWIPGRFTNKIITYLSRVFYTPGDE